MREELDQALVKDFPNLYRHRHNEAYCIWWGFATGDGWEPLVRELSVKLEALIVALPKRQQSKYFVTQVKEKFGGLRFSLSKATPEMSALLDEAEKKSFETCEGCGSPGTLRRGSWITVACDPCQESRKAAQKAK
jgi:hypothetical protein